jgi:DNA replication protein DnaC
MGLEVGDLVCLRGKYAGWAKREVDSTQHLDMTYRETDAEQQNYLRHYWLAVWDGAQNRVLAERVKQVAQRDAAQAKYTKDYVNRWGPQSAYRGKTFANFKAETPKQKAALEPSSAFPYDASDDYNSRVYSNLILNGPAGVGKTHLAAAIFTERQESVGATEFITAKALIRKFREKEAKESVLMARYGDGKDDSADALDEGCEVLIIDDLGAGDDADAYAAEIFSEILDRRIGADLLTVITTNCTADELQLWLGERGYSRLRSRCSWNSLDGDDHRLRDPRPQKNLKDST